MRRKTASMQGNKGETHVEYMQLRREALTACTDRCSQSCSSESYPAFTEDTSTHTRKENSVWKGKKNARRSQAAGHISLSAIPHTDLA